jgi:hypothetical protein
MAGLAAWIDRRSPEAKVTLGLLAVTAAVGLAACDSGDSGDAASPSPDVALDNVKRRAAKWSDAIVPPHDKSKRDVYEESWSMCGIASAAYEEQAEFPHLVDAARAYAKENYPPVFERPAYEGCLFAFRPT